MKPDNIEDPAADIEGTVEVDEDLSPLSTYIEIVKFLHIPAQDVQAKNLHKSTIFRQIAP